MATQSCVSLAVSCQGEGKTILCLHGHPGSGASLSVFTSFLSQNYRTVVPDLRGYAQSKASGSFEMSDHLRDLDLLWQQYDLDKCIILGWSLGGILAMEMAMRHPEQVKGLILVATAARPRSNHPPITLRDNLYTVIAGVLNRIHPGWQWNIDTFGKRSLFQYLIRRHSPATYQYLAREALPAYLKTSRWATRALNNALRQGYDRLGDLDKISCPCLLLAGQDDLHITPRSSQETAQYLPYSNWICYPNTAHLFPWEIPGQVQRDIEQWLNKANLN